MRREPYQKIKSFSSYTIHSPFIYHAFTIHLPFIYHDLQWFNEHQKGFKGLQAFILQREFTSLISWLPLRIFSLKKKYQCTWWKNKEWYLIDSILLKPNLHHNVFIWLIVKWVPLKWCISHRVQAPPNLTNLCINHPMVGLVHQGCNTILSIKRTSSILWLSKGSSGYVLQKEY